MIAGEGRLSANMDSPLVLVHGGAGSVPSDSLPRHRTGCRLAAEAGAAVIGDGAVEAACAAVRIMEDDEVYNAGTGCALNLIGAVSLDAAVMCGATIDAGGVCALGPFKHPVSIAQALLHESPVLIAGAAADDWALAHGFEQVPEDDLITPKSAAAWQRVVKEGGASNWAGGTVGAVARDAQGRLCAAASTGGTIGKLPGRVGDTPLVGAGTYADDVCAISATGEGEAFVRAVFAARLSDAIRAGGEPQEELEKALARIERDFGGLGGAIMLTRDGGPFMAWTTDGMSHAWV